MTIAVGVAGSLCAVVVPVSAQSASSIDLSSASSVEPLLSSTSITTSDAALADDAEYYVEDYDVTLTEAMRRLQLQAELGETRADLKKAAADRYAGEWLEHYPRFQLVLRVTGDLSTLPDVEQVVDRSPIPVVVLDQQTHSVAEMLQASASALPKLETIIPEVLGLDLDVRTGEIVVMAQRDLIDDQATDDLAVLASTLGVAMRFEAVDAPWAVYMSTDYIAGLGVSLVYG
jgi:hypothetical protein